MGGCITAFGMFGYHHHGGEERVAAEARGGEADEIDGRLLVQWRGEAHQEHSVPRRQHPSYKRNYGWEGTPRMQPITTASSTFGL